MRIDMTDRRHLSACAGLLAWMTLMAALAASAWGADAPPPRLSFDELIALSREDNPDPALQAKLHTILTTPVVRNRTQTAAGPSAVLRVTEWNIARGENLGGIEEALTSPETFVQHAQREKKSSAADLVRLRNQAALLRQSDVVILNEVDIGVKRTDYKNVVDELADLLGMSSAYAVEFVEVDGLEDLGTEPAVLETPALSTRMTEDLKPDRSRYQGLHVNAILSRYPLRNVRVISLPVCHDWYADEKQAISQLEKAKRKAADIAFLERIAREIRRGNRNALVGEIAVPGLAQPVRLVNAHLENKCKGNCRDRQMRTILKETGDTTGPLVLAGDLNTTGTDGTPTSIRYELMTRVKDYQFWVSTLLKFTPVGVPAFVTMPFNFWKNYRDPTARHIPFFGRNPEARLFANVRNFKFADGGRFDFRGVKRSNLQKSGKTLSDSNERANKGFVPTFSMERNFGGVFRYRLDWIFVKPPKEAAKKSRMGFQPEMPVTMNVLNTALAEELSDHAPISVEIPTL